MEKYKEEINKIIGDYRNNGQAAAELYAKAEEVKNTMNLIEVQRQKLSAELADIRAAEKTLFERMAADGVDVEAVKSEIENMVKEAISKKE